MLDIQRKPFGSPEEPEPNDRVLESLRRALEAADDPDVRASIVTAMEASNYTNGASAREIISNAIINANANTDDYQGEPVITENARVVLEKRYLLKDNDGNLAETPTMMFKRVADSIAEIDKLYFESSKIESEEAQLDNLVKSTACLLYTSDAADE